MSSSLFCPACGKEKNRAGEALGSVWAVATHVAGSIRFKDRLHRSWAQQHAPGVNLSQNVPKLAEALMWTVRQSMAAQRPQVANIPKTPIELLQEFERSLHGYVRRRLEREFGADGEAWWVQGVPLSIRKRCAEEREASAEREELYAYTYLIDLKEIMDKKWALFADSNERVIASYPGLQKKEFLALLTKGNNVRNRYSHPVRASDPGTEQYKNDLNVAQKLLSIVTILGKQT